MQVSADVKLPGPKRPMLELQPFVWRCQYQNNTESVSNSKTLRHAKPNHALSYQITQVRPYDSSTATTFSCLVLLALFVSSAAPTSFLRTTSCLPHALAAIRAFATNRAATRTVRSVGRPASAAVRFVEVEAGSALRLPKRPVRMDSSSRS